MINIRFLDGYEIKDQLKNDFKELRKGDLFVFPDSYASEEPDKFKGDFVVLDIIQDESPLETEGNTLLIMKAEELFFQLEFHKVESKQTKNLIRLGYITEDLINTKKADTFREKFINLKKKPLYQAVKKYGSVKPEAIKEQIEVSKPGVTRILAEALAEKDLLIKNDDGTYSIKA